MKKTENKSNKKLVLTVGSLSTLCVAVLAGTYFLTREPKNTFTPVTAENGTTTNTWEDNADVESVSSPSAPQNDTQVTGTKTDNTQTVVSEDASGTVTELSGSTTKDEIEETVHLEKPETNDDTTNPEKQPEYDDSVPTTPDPTEPPADDKPNNTPPAKAPSDSHPGQVYDPVFGWITTGDTNQDNVDNDGDINKQIGTMGN